jgi:hypothetical protein
MCRMAWVSEVGSFPIVMQLWFVVDIVGWRCGRRRGGISWVRSGRCRRL